MTRYITITLTVAQAERVLDSLDAHFAGDTSEGDLAWSAAYHKCAQRAYNIIASAASSAK